MQLKYLFDVTFAPPPWMDAGVYERETHAFVAELHQWIANHPLVGDAAVIKLTLAAPGEVIPPRPEAPT